MKRWALVTVLLYGAMLVTLTAPVLWVTMGSKLEPGGVRELYGYWGYWLWLGIMLVAQGALLLVPVRVAERRPLVKRPLFVPATAAAFLSANLFFAGIMSVSCALLGDQAFSIFEFMAGISQRAAELVPGLLPRAAQAGIPVSEQAFIMGSIFGTLGVLWLLWGLVFYQFARDVDDAGFVRRTIKWLLRGSILELLVAVPSHVIVRSRGDCCAPMATFWGIVTGISVMLLAFGPGVLFLFAERMRRLHPKHEPDRLVDD